MNNIDKYNNTFNTIFNIKVEEMNGDINPDSIHKWDSITHLRLVNTIEDEFDVMFESEDILDFRSYDKGKEILRKYDVEI
jgi:acyl carrier protein